MKHKPLLGYNDDIDLKDIFLVMVLVNAYCSELKKVVNSDMRWVTDWKPSWK